MGELGAFLHLRMTIKQVIRTIFNVLYQIVSTAVIVIGLILGILYLCGIRLYHVKSGSMGEQLPVGCVCFVSTYTPYDAIQVDDVISFRVSEDMRVTHRAVSITKGGIITQGDENENADPDPVTQENYIGKTVFALPYLGYGLEALHTVRGTVTVLILASLMVIAGFVYRHTSQ